MARTKTVEPRSGSPGEGPPGEPFPTWVRWLLPLALFLVTLVPFWPARQFGFVDYDDDRNFYPQYNQWFNAASHELSGTTLEWMLKASHFGHYQPLTWISYGLDCALSGRFDPRDFHRTNLLLHGLNAVLVYWLARLLLQAIVRGRAREPAWTLAAAATSLFYALHPLRVESVAWITERRDVLSTAFLLLSVLGYLRFATAPGQRALWLLLSLLAFTLSLFSKAWGITLPVVLLLIDLYPLRRRSGAEREPWLRLLLEKLGYVVPAVVFAWMAKGAQAEIGATVSLAEHSLLQRFAQACYGLVFYLLKTVWPLRLSPLYLLEPDLDPTRPVYLASMGLVAGAAVALWLLRRRLPGLVAAALAYAILVSPVLGFLQSGSQKVADRYTYVCAVPLTLLAGWAVLRLAQPREAARVHLGRGVALTTVVVVSIALGTLARAQTEVWRDSESVYRRIVAVEPTNYFGLHCLSAVLQQASGALPRERLEEALALAEASVAAHRGAGNVQARQNVAGLLRRLGRNEEADQALLEALEVAPDFTPVLQEVVARRLGAGDADGALELVERSLARKPRFLDGYAQLARVQTARGRPDLAQEAWRRGLAVDPWWPQGNHVLGLEALGAGDPITAERYLVQALRSGAGTAEMLVDLGRAVQAQGRTQEAAMHYQQALAFDSGNARAQALLQALGGAPAR